MTYDVVVIGGGPAGLSGAVALGRALRSVLVIDSGTPRNAPAEGIHNFLTRDGVTPAEFGELGRSEVTRYGGEFRSGSVVSVRRADHFVVELDDGTTVEARRLLVTSGAVDILPEIEGLAAMWGKTVLHCPYCHGYEVRDRPIGIIATSEFAMHGGLLWSQWTGDLVLFLNDAFAPDDDRRAQLTGRGVRLIEGKVTAADPTGVTLASGEKVAREYLVVQTRLEVRADYLAPLGFEPVEHPMGVGTILPAEDQTGRTTIPGVWVAGNAAEPMAQVISSAASGLAAGAMINMDLITNG